MDYEKIFPFWMHLTKDEKEFIKRSCYTEKYDKGMLMSRSEENCEGLITVLCGQLRVYVLSDEGREVTLFRVFENDVCALSASCLMDSITFDIHVISRQIKKAVQVYSLFNIEKKLK